MTSPVTLIDTSAWILALRRHPNLAVRHRVATAIGDETAAICGIVLLELLGGTISDAEFARLEADLAGVIHLPITDIDWRESARLMFHLRRAGTTAPAQDILIASVAMRHRAMVVHADAHYERIRAFAQDHPAYRDAPQMTESLLHLLQ